MKEHERMDRVVLAALAFLMMLAVWVTVFVVLAPIMPILILAGFAAWLVIRKPFHHPGRLEGDLTLFCQTMARIVRRIVDSLYPRDRWE
jgi:hypothetical protein